MKKLFFMCAIVAALASCSSQKAASGKSGESKFVSEEQRALLAAVKDTVFVTEVDELIPYGSGAQGASGHVTVSKAKCISRLPYKSGYNPGSMSTSGLSYNGPISRYTITEHKDKVEVKMVVHRDVRTCTYVFEIYPDGYTDLIVDPGNGNLPCSYKGKSRLKK